MPQGTTFRLAIGPLVEPLEPRLLLDGQTDAVELFSVSPALLIENQGQWAEALAPAAPASAESPPSLENLDMEQAQAGAGIAPLGRFEIYTDASLATPGLTGSYVNQSLRWYSPQDDWRVTQVIASTRVDPTINFTSSAWGSRAAVGLTGGSDGDWDDFSVQWDGYVKILTHGIRLATWSDDGSRMWVDINGDGFFDSSGPEFVNNNWGNGQAATTGPSSVRLTPDVYRIRLQYEEGNGGNVMQLLAPTPALGGQLHVNRSTGGDQSEVSVDADAAGNYVAVWQGANVQGWGTNDIYFQRFNALGTPVGPETRANPDWHGEQTAADVAVAGDGHFVVTWTSDNDGSGSGVYARVFAADGSPQTDAFRINTYTAGDQNDSEVAIDATGNFVVVWASNGEDESGWGVYGQRYGADGTAQGGEFRANTYTSSEQMRPAVAIKPDGAFVVTWDSNGQDGSYEGVYGQRYASDGTAMGGEFRANTYTSYHQLSPAVTFGADGDFLIAWQSYPYSGEEGSSWGIYAQRYATDGTALGSEFRVNTYTSSDQISPAVAIKPDGAFVVTWASNGQDGSSWGVYAQRYAADGTPVGGEFRANTYTYNEQRNPALALGAGGDFLVVWQSYPSDEEGWSWGVFGQLYGTGLAQADLVPVRVTAPDGANLGQTINVSAEIRNQGGVDAGPFVCQYYLSTDATITTADTPLGGQFTVSGVAAMATYTDARSFSVPNVTPGNLYVGIIVDTTSAVSEADETNNVYQISFNEPTVNIAPLPLIGPERRANMTTAGDQSQAAVGLDSSGNYVVVWYSQNQDGSGFGVYGQRFDASGSPVGQEFRANTTTSGDQTQPEVAVAPNGRFVIAWQSNGQDGSGWGIYAQRYAADGTAQGSEFRVNTYTNSDQSDPSVAIAESGDFVIVWRSNGQDVGNNGGIYGQRYLADGTPNGPEFWICSNAAPDQYRPAVAMNNSGQFVVTWDNDSTVYARRFLVIGMQNGPTSG